MSLLIIKYNKIFVLSTLKQFYRNISNKECITSMLQQAIERHTSLIYCLTGCRCRRHITKDKPCDIEVVIECESNDDDTDDEELIEKQQIIYGATTNYLIPKYKYFCSKVPSIRYDLLLSSHLLQQGPNNFIKIVTDKDKEIYQDLFSIYKHFVTSDLLYTINDLTINDVNGKSVSKWRNAIISKFVTTAQTILNSRCLAYDATKLRSVIKKNVLPLHYFNHIKNFLWRENWSVFVGM